MTCTCGLETGGSEVCASEISREKRRSPEQTASIELLLRLTRAEQTRVRLLKIPAQSTLFPLARRLVRLPPLDFVALLRPSSQPARPRQPLLYRPFSTSKMSSGPIKPLAPLSENPKVHPGPGSSNSTAPGHNSRRASHSSSGRPDPLSSIAHASVRPPVATRPQSNPLTDEVVVSAGFSHRSRRHPDRLAHRPARRVDRRRKGKATRSLRSRRRARQGPPQGPRHWASLPSLLRVFQGRNTIWQGRRGFSFVRGMRILLSRIPEKPPCAHKGPPG